MTEEFKVLKRTVELPGGQEVEVDFIIAFDSALDNVAVHKALDKLSAEQLPEGYMAYEFAYVFNQMDSAFFLAVSILLQQLDV